MASSIEYILKLTTNGNTVLGQLQKKTESWGNSLEKSAKKFSNSMDLLANSAVFDNLDRARQKIDTFSMSGASLETKLKELKATTNITDEALKVIENSARESAIAFGTDAAQNVDSYNEILSSLSPELVKNATALKQMGVYGNILSKQMGGDTLASTRLLTTAMNQFGVDLSDPMKAAAEMGNFLNIMSKGAKEGSAKLPAIGQALEKTGANAMMANLTFAETNAAIQILDKNGKKGAEGGTALASALAIIGKGRFMPKDVLTSMQKAGVDINVLSDKSLTFGQRLQSLKPILKDSALLQALFGEGATVAGYNLIKEADGFDSFTKSLEGSNDAQRQADIIMSSYEERQKRVKAQFDDWRISIFGATSDWMLWGGVVADVGLSIGEAALAYNSLETLLRSQSILTATTWLGSHMAALKGMTIWTSIATTATNLFSVAWWSANYAMFAIPLTIAAIVGAIGYVIYKVNGWGDAWNNVVDGIINSGKMLLTYIKTYVKTWLEPWFWAFDQIRIGWNKTKELFGSKTASAEITAIEQAGIARRKGIVEDGKLMVSQAQEAGKNFSGALNSLSWDSGGKSNSGFTNTFGLGVKSLIPTLNSSSSVLPVLPNATGNGGNGSGGNSGGAGNTGGGKTKQTADAIATGGTKSTTVHINFKDLVGQLTVTSASGKFQESASEIERQVTEALLRVLNMAGLNAG